ADRIDGTAFGCSSAALPNSCWGEPRRRFRCSGNPWNAIPATGARNYSWQLRSLRSGGTGKPAKPQRNSADFTRSIGRVRSNSSGCRVPGPRHTGPRSTRPLTKSADSAFSIDSAAARRLSGGGLREFARQLDRHLVVLLKRRQGLLRKLLQLGIATRALFLLA